MLKNKSGLMAGWNGDVVGQVPFSDIHKFARRVANRFRPDKIILFGSYAYGQPRPNSDVDLLIVMPTADERAQADRIDRTLNPRFHAHLIVRTPKNLRQRLEWGDWFLREILSRGTVLYAKPGAKDGELAFFRKSPGGGKAGMNKLTKEWVEKAEEDFSVAEKLAQEGSRFDDSVCFHYQHKAEARCI